MARQRSGRKTIVLSAFSHLILLCSSHTSKFIRHSRPGLSINNSFLSLHSSISNIIKSKIRELIPFTLSFTLLFKYNAGTVRELRLIRFSLSLFLCSHNVNNINNCKNNNIMEWYYYNKMAQWHSCCLYITNHTFRLVSTCNSSCWEDMEGENVDRKGTVRLCQKMSWTKANQQSWFHRYV